MTDPAATPTTRRGLRVERLSVTIGSATLLRDLDLAVEGGSLTAVVGPSGAGKTTLLRAIAGLVPAAGSVHLDGRDLTGVPVHRRGVAVVFQEPRLFPDLDVADNVAFALRLARVPRAERRRRAADLLDEVGLAGMATRPVADLSGGEQQRVSLARALAARPSLLLLDEPLAAVDPMRRADLRRLIGAVIADRDLTAVHVTHDRLEAAELGDHVALLMEGRIIEEAPPEELFERPRNAVTARFLGSTNLVDGEVRDGVLTTAAGEVSVRGPDGRAAFTIRPERVHVGSGPLRARVVQARYQGGHVLVHLDAGGLRLESHVPPAAAPVVGADVAFDLPVEALWRLGDGGVGQRPAADGWDEDPDDRAEV
jgi:ABC-type Fe3+/spermidine/putrescine transport system ATPase subunit